jgi:hypothetical protein
MPREIFRRMLDEEKKTDESMEQRVDVKMDV